MTDTSQVALEFLGGNIGGYLLGRGVVKLTKLLLTIASIVGTLFTITLATLASRGYVTVEWTRIASELQAWMIEMVTHLTSQGLSGLQPVVSMYLPVGGGAITGFAYALKTT